MLHCCSVGLGLGIPVLKPQMGCLLHDAHEHEVQASRAEHWMSLPGQLRARMARSGPLLAAEQCSLGQVSWFMWLLRADLPVKYREGAASLLNSHCIIHTASHNAKAQQHVTYVGPAACMQHVHAHSSRVQGDFSQALMELMVPQLNATATALNHFALNGTLGSAIQNSAARSDDPAILSCLSVRISRPASQLEKGSLPCSDMPGCLCMHRAAAHASRSPCAEPHMPWCVDAGCP